MVYEDYEEEEEKKNKNAEIRLFLVSQVGTPPDIHIYVSVEISMVMYNV